MVAGTKSELDDARHGDGLSGGSLAILILRAATQLYDTVARNKFNDALRQVDRGARMPTFEGSYRTGWLVLFSPEETTRIAQPVGDYAGPIAAAAALAPEPFVSNAIAIGTSVLIIFAKKAAREDQSVGLYIRGNPFWLMYKSFRGDMRYQRLSDLPRALYTQLIVNTGHVPFLHNEKDQQSLADWRRAVGM